MGRLRRLTHEQPALADFRELTEGTAGCEVDRAAEECRVLVASASRVMYLSENPEAPTIRYIGQQIWGAQRLHALERHTDVPEGRSKFGEEDGLYGRTAIASGPYPEDPRYASRDALQFMARAFVRMMALRRYEAMEIMEARCTTLFGAQIWWQTVYEAHRRLWWILSPGGAR